MSFPQLQVASGFSMKYGAMLPEDLVATAKNIGITQLALTDRDEIGGAVRFIKSCITHGVDPILGIDVAITATGLLAKNLALPKSKTPAKGGSYRDVKHYRSVLLARGPYGWAALVNIAARIGTAKFHDPAATISIAEIASALQQSAPAGYQSATSPLVVLLTAESEFANAVLGRRPDIAVGIVKQWREIAGVMPVVAVTSHQTQTGNYSSSAARKLLKFADEHGLKAVLVNSVRYLAATDGYIADVLDAIRGLIPIHPKYLSASNTAAYLKSAAEMNELAIEITQDQNRANKLIIDTQLLAASCVLNPVRDLAWGRIYLPELDLLTGVNSAVAQHQPDDAKRAQAMLRSKAEAALADFGLANNATARARLAAELEVVAQLGFASYFSSSKNCG